MKGPDPTPDLPPTAPSTSEPPAATLIFSDGSAQPRATRVAWSTLTVVCWLGFLYLAVPPARAVMESTMAALASIPHWLATVAVSIANAREPGFDSISGTIALVAGVASTWRGWRLRSRRSTERAASVAAARLRALTEQPPVHFSSEQMAAIRVSQRLVAHHDANGRLQAVTLLSTTSGDAGSTQALQVACEPFLSADAERDFTHGRDAVAEPPAPPATYEPAVPMAAAQARQAVAPPPLPPIVAPDRRSTADGWITTLNELLEPTGSSGWAARLPSDTPPPRAVRRRRHDRKPALPWDPASLMPGPVRQVDRVFSSIDALRDALEEETVLRARRRPGGMPIEPVAFAGAGPPTRSPDPAGPAPPPARAPRRRGDEDAIETTNDEQFVHLA